ncbi:MAG: hypothetical protein ACK5IC_02915 [Moheibacter sp.]
MSLPELGLSLSITDNPGSPLYAGVGEREHMSDFDSAQKEHIIKIIISDEEVGKVVVDLQKNGITSQIELPTYKMSLTDDKTNETNFYEVTRDIFLSKELKSNSIGGFSLFGWDLFKKTTYTLPAIAFEPLTSSIEQFDVSRYRIMREDYLSYTLKKRDSQTANLVAGILPENMLSDATDNFFCVIDNSNGQRFIGDIRYREKFIRSIPKVEVHLIKRNQSIKEFELDKKGKINKIIYI